MKHLFLYLLLVPGLFSQTKPSLMGVFAHPDDETIIGALFAKYAREGHKVTLITLTSGQKGVTPNTNLPAGDELGAAREKEGRCSSEKLGAADHSFLGFQDGTLYDPRTLEQAARQVLEKINFHKPDVVVTWGPDGVTGHPDHRAVSNLTTQIFQQRRLLSYKPRRLYYIALSERQFEGAEMDGRRVPFRTVADDLITTWVDARKYSAPAFAAIQCHKTQWDAKRMEWNQKMFEEIMEGKITLRLAVSDTDPPRGRETDIFERTP
jgi:LmbE family N-acetylglucosaminyl deacetylase